MVCKITLLDFQGGTAWVGAAVKTGRRVMSTRYERKDEERHTKHPVIHEGYVSLHGADSQEQLGDILGSVGLIGLFSTPSMSEGTI
jgi:hypothetical protein